MSPHYVTITPFFPTSTNFRGPFVYDQVKAIEESGKYTVIVLKPKKWYSLDKDYVYNGIKVYRFKVFELPSNILPGLFDFLSIWNLKRKLKAMGVKIDDVTVAHAHVTGLGVFATAIKKQNVSIKTILQHHGFDVLSLEIGRLKNISWHRNWVKNYGITICNKIDLHIGVSAKTLHYLKSYSQINLKENSVLFNGVASNKFYKKEGMRDERYFTIGCIGNFWPLKDQITLLKALKILVEKGMTTIRCKFIGSGMTLESCQFFVRQNQLMEYVSFQSEVPHQELNNFYNSLDLFVLPSYYEAFGCVYTEAYACGVPFIAVEGQGIGEILPSEEHYKWLIHKGDFVHLAEIIQNYIANRYEQKLSKSITIDDTIGDFLDTL